ncbi:AAA family ATPase [Exiguobacterium indicum]|uniref:AAA family ATPase n=1 Tax=Exiguobacterium indicum TaxID=296995 RepID=UPI00073690F5|nr:AAA family ATPase [Exiguobacterium indicum]
MLKYFIQDIYINNVRNHNNLHISLSKEKIKHLIITGRNGSGKTSIMEAIRNHLKIFEDYKYKDLKTYAQSIKELNKTKDFWMQQIEEKKSETQVQLRNLEAKEKIKDIDNNIAQMEKFLNHYNNGVSLKLNQDEDIDSHYKNGKFIISYFSANRMSNMMSPTGVEKIQLSAQSSINENIGSLFIKYLVDLKTQELFAAHEGDHDFSNKLKNWFEDLESNFKALFENEKLLLQYDYKNYNFLIIEPGKVPYNLNSLSSGFSSILNIVTELIMRMETTRSSSYDVQGIVLIDEIEAHLHVSLQKKIFKFLTDFFPNIQFIVTTHSPFIITSIEDAVIYDLETNTFLEDLSVFSYKAILEEFFKVDQYSDIAKNKIEEYKNLSSNKSNLTQSQKDKLLELNEELSGILDVQSPEINLYKAQIDLKNLLEGIQND